MVDWRWRGLTQGTVNSSPWEWGDQEHRCPDGLPSSSKALSKVWGLSQAMMGCEESRELTPPRRSELLNIPTWHRDFRTFLGQGTEKSVPFQSLSSPHARSAEGSLHRPLARMRGGDRN